MQGQLGPKQQKGRQRAKIQKGAWAKTQKGSGVIRTGQEQYSSGQEFGVARTMYKQCRARGSHVQKTMTTCGGASTVLGVCAGSKAVDQQIQIWNPVSIFGDD
jgi:hypothetical protein